MQKHPERCSALQRELGKAGIFAALIQKPRNLYYYAGTGQPSHLWVPAEGEPVLFTRRAHGMAREASWINQVYEGNHFTEVLAVLADLGMKPGSSDTIGAEIDFIPAKIIDRLKRDLGASKLAGITDLIMRQRLVKSADEIEKIKEAAVLWALGHEAVLRNVREGFTEYQVSATMEHAARFSGGDGTVWFHRWDAGLPGGGIAASGPNAWAVSGHAMTVTGVGMSPALPWGASGRILRQKDLLVMDYGISKQSYHCDAARTYCVGKASGPQKDLWNRLTELHDRVIDRIRPGVSGADLWQTAIDTATAFGLDQYFMGVGDDRGDYIGHSIGLELDEWPVLGPHAHDPLPTNAVITIEPKFMVPGVGGVMVEDSIRITENGHEIMTEMERLLFEL
jgi:Xaa-Pro dipeptidase